MTEKPDDVLDLYQRLMEEIKVRINSVDQGTLGLLYSLPPTIVREFCFLQLRLCCELIALSCLVAHGDLSEATRLRGDYQADKIMSGLDKLNQDFFPKPCEIIDMKSHKHLEFINKEITKEDFLQLYRECSGYLHKGSLKNLLKARFPRQLKYRDITARAQKLLDLLAVHSIMDAKSQTFIVCILNPGPGSLSFVARGERLPHDAEIPSELRQ